MMKESLPDLIKSGATEEPITFNEESLNIPNVETVPEEVESVSSIIITSLGTWFDENVNNFPNIRKPKTIAT